MGKEKRPRRKKCSTKKLLGTETVVHVAILNRANVLRVATSSPLSLAPIPSRFLIREKKKKRKNDISTRPKARLVENQTVFLPKHCAMHGCLNFSRCSTRTTNFRRFDVASVCHTVIPNLRITADESERKISDFNMIKFTLNRLGKNLISKSLPKEFSLVVIEIFRNFSIERKIVEICKRCRNFFSNFSTTYNNKRI